MRMFLLNVLVFYAFVMHTKTGRNLQNDLSLVPYSKAFNFQSIESPLGI